MVSVFFIFLFLITANWTFEALRSKANNMMNGQASTDWSSLLVVVFHAVMWHRIVHAYVVHTWCAR